MYVTGWFSSSVDFGGGALTSVGDSDFFVASYDRDGAHNWSSRFGGDSAESLGQSRVAVNQTGNVAVTGFYFDTVDFCCGSETSAGGQDIFLLHLPQ